MRRLLPRLVLLLIHLCLFHLIVSIAIYSYIDFFNSSARLQSRGRPCISRHLTAADLVLDPSNHPYRSITLELVSPNFGNGIACLLSALRFCDILGIYELNCGANFFFITAIFVTTRGVTVYPGPSVPEGFPEPTITTFFRPWGYPSCLDWNTSEIADTVRWELLKMVGRPTVPIDDTTLVLSFRGGDIFRAPDPVVVFDYQQPVCHYYTDVVRYFRKKFGDGVRIWAVSEDYANPCLNESIALGAEFVGGSILDDAATLVYAPNLVLSRSSFARTGLWLSPFPKNFWVFDGDPESIYTEKYDFRKRFLEHGEHWECTPLAHYRDNCVGQWGPTMERLEEQIEILKNDRCIWKWIPAIERMPYQPPE
jgi:hypothetical protein